jgi:hypothetical protein
VLLEELLVLLKNVDDELKLLLDEEEELVTEISVDEDDED